MAGIKHEHRSVKHERYPASHLAYAMSAHKAGLAARIRFQLERWILRGLHYRLALAALLVASVALLAGELVFLFAPGESGVSDAIWWAFLRLTDPGYLGDDEGLAARTISTAVTVLGYVLFMGLLIAIMTQWLNQWITRLEMGVTPAAVSHHVLILGWTHRTPAIANALLGTEGRLERFLARQSRKELTIVILVNEITTELRQELREQLGTRWNDRQILLRAGSPQRMDHLQRVAYDEAAVIILPGADFTSDRPGVVDAETIKTLLSVSTELESGNGPHPLAVAGLFDADRAPLARAAYRGETEVVVVDEIVSQLISRCVQQPGIWGVFDELLRLHAGNSVYIRDFPKLTGVPLGELQSRLPGAVLLGRISRGKSQAELLPDPAATLAEGDQLVLISSQFANTEPQDPDSSLPPRGKRITRQSDQAPRKLLVLGWSRKVPPLLSDLSEYYKGAITVDAVGLSPIEEREQQLACYGHGTELANVQMVEANFLVMDTLTSLRPQDYDAVIVVARENLESNENADASSVTTQLALHRIFRESQPRPHLLFEILDEANRRLFNDAQDDVMVSPMLVSYMLSQVALRRELGAVFDVLSHSGGPELTLVPAAGYLPCKEPVCFSDIQRAAHEHGEIALGLRIDHQGNRRVVLNPDRSELWQLADGDQLIVLADFPEAAS
jgi:Trk K+ transport system NAD-binding subunit